MGTSRQARSVVLGAVGALAAAHAAPAITSLGPLRRRLFPDLAGLGDPGHVALTFDDGPDPRSTPAFLDVLAEYQVSATFFVLGRMLHAAPDVGRELVEAGHEIAVHGWEHRCMLVRGPAATYDDLARTVEAIAGTTGAMPRWYRPPYGVLSLPALRAARRLDLTPVLWTNWGRDWTRTATPESIHATVTRDLLGGGTVLLHDSDCTSARDSWRRTLGALPPLLEHVRGRGLTPGPLRDHAATKPASHRPRRR